MKEVRLLAGGIGSGKAYIMSKMVQELKETGNSIYLVSFADPIKQIVKTLYGYDKNGNRVKHVSLMSAQENLDDCISLINKKLSDEYIPFDTEYEMWLTYFQHADNFFKTGLAENDKQELKEVLRFLMQKIGTEIGQRFKKTIWPMIAFDKILNNKNIDYVIIDDWRFMFELNKAIETFQHTGYEVVPYFIDADIEVRAKRRNITVEELINQSQHSSEREGQEIIRPFMQMYHPQNIIVNN
jgi:hypothetical protein